MESNEKPPPYQEFAPTSGGYPPSTDYLPPQPTTYATQPQQPPTGGYEQPQPLGYPPPSGGGGYPSQGQPTPTVIMQPVVTLTTAPVLRDRPMNCICPNCHNNIVTSCDYVSGSLTWIAALIICLLFWPCAWIPFVLDDCKDVSHRCPMCNNLIGFYRRM